MTSVPEFSVNDTFLNDLLNDSNLRKQVFDSDFLKPNSAEEKKEKRTSRKATSLKPEAPGKENTKKGNNPRRNSEKPVREPLKVVSDNKKATAPKKKTSPKKAEPKKALKSGPTLKIHIYQDGPCQVEEVVEEEEEEEGKKRRSQRLSKSLEPCKEKTGGRTSAENKKKSSSPRKKKNSGSLTDLTAIKTPEKKQRNSLGMPPEIEHAFEKVEGIFPNVDPEYLKSECIRLKGSVLEIIDNLIVKEKMGELPTKADYMRKQETERLQDSYLENFSVENFLKVIPDPWNYFLNTARQNCVRYSDHSFHYLKNKYKKHYSKAIQEALVKHGHSLYLANKELKRKTKGVNIRATNRSKAECDAGKPTTFDPQFVYEVAFIENEEKIKKHVKKTETVKSKRVKAGQKAGTLLECQSCCDPTLLWEEAVSCPANHVFCKDCILKYVNREIEKKNIHFKCQANCNEEFPLKTLQEFLAPDIMSKIAKELQSEEIRSADIEGLVSCPFCPYVAVMPPELSVLKCLNTACMMESCRYCREPNHVPLKCNELNKFEKTIIEDKDSFENSVTFFGQETFLEQPSVKIEAESEDSSSEGSNATEIATNLSFDSEVFDL